MKKYIIIFMAIMFAFFYGTLTLAQRGTWKQKADIPTARWQAESCELDGKIYVIGGGPTASSSVNTMEVYDPNFNTWDTNKQPMPTARTEFCVAAVNGKIYAIGGAVGHTANIHIGVVEEYDPVTDTWDTNKQPMPTPRKGAVCGVINNKIYVAGGSSFSNYVPTNTLEEYDPETDTWTEKANLILARYDPTAAVHNDMLYVSGGLIGSPWTGQTKVQRYDPAANRWDLISDMNYGRVGHTTSVIDGKIYAIGGDTQPPVLEEIEVYDPQAGTWTVIDDKFPNPVTFHSASVYEDQIYIFSGSTTSLHDGLTLSNNVNSYKPPAPVESDAWTKLADIPTARWQAESCELNGKIYVIGGALNPTSSLNTMEVYDPAINTWDTTKTDMPTKRTEFCLAAVNGKIYAIGGANAHVGYTVYGAVEEYDPVTDTWDTNKQPMPTPRKGAVCGVIDNKIYVACGTESASGFLTSKTLEVYDPATDSWDTKIFPILSRYDPSAVALNNLLYVSGGLTGTPWIGQKGVQTFDPAANSWNIIESMDYGRVGHTTNAIHGKIYAIGGDTQPPVLEEIEVYDPQAGTWTVIEDKLPTPVTFHTASVYEDQIYIFSGSTTSLHDGLTLTSDVYCYTPPDTVTSIVSQTYLTPEDFVLHQNYPNPFNPATTIKYSIPVVVNTERLASAKLSEAGSIVSLVIYDVLGRQVAILVNEKQRPGNYEVKWDAAGQASGVYFYKLTAGNFSEIKKMILLR